MEFMKGEFGDLVHFGPPLNTYFLFNPDQIKQILVDEKAKIIKGKQSLELESFIGKGIFTAEGKEWRKKRKTLGKVFHHKNIKAQLKQIEQLTLEHINSWGDEESLNLSQEIFHLTFKISGLLFFGGLDNNRSLELKEIVENAGDVIFNRISTPINFPLWVPLPTNIKFNKGLKIIDEYIYDLIRERKINKVQTKKDLLDQLIFSDEKLTNKEIRDELVTLMLAGYETTASMLTWTFHLLSQNDDKLKYYENVCKPILDLESMDIKSGELTLLLKESLRLYPPSPIISRQNTSEIKIGEIKIPKESNFVMSQYITHRDERYWVRALDFNPERFKDESDETLKYKYFPFSDGPRRCIGEMLAYSEGVIILHTLFNTLKLELKKSERNPVCKVILTPDKPVEAKVKFR